MSTILLKTLKISKEDLDNILDNHIVYSSFFVFKKSGKKRRIDSPSPKLKDVQQSILFNIVYKMKPHHSVHGFVVNKSPRSSAYVQKIVKKNNLFLTVDLKNYFNNISSLFVKKAFIYILAYLNKVNKNNKIKEQFDIKKDAEILTTLTTYKYRLPQGAPTSPALANIITYSMDVAMEYISIKNNITYTRYADDLTFGHKDLKYNMDSFLKGVKGIIKSYHFIINEEKVRFLRPHRLQQITGVTVNTGLGVSKKYYNNTKAGVYNLVTKKAQYSPKQKLKLRGRIEWIKSLNKKKGDKLLALYNTA